MAVKSSSQSPLGKPPSCTSKVSRGRPIRIGCRANLHLKFGSTGGEVTRYKRCTLTLRMVKFDATVSEVTRYEW